MYLKIWTCEICRHIHVPEMHFGARPAFFMHQGRIVKMDKCVPGHMICAAICMACAWRMHPNHLGTDSRICWCPGTQHHQAEKTSLMFSHGLGLEGPTLFMAYGFYISTCRGGLLIREKWVLVHYRHPRFAHSLTIISYSHFLLQHICWSWLSMEFWSFWVVARCIYLHYLLSAFQSLLWLALCQPREALEGSLTCLGVYNGLAPRNVEKCRATFRVSISCIKLYVFWLQWLYVFWLQWVSKSLYSKTCLKTFKTCLKQPSFL